MIRHIVMWKLADFAEGAVKSENALKLKSRLDALQEKIPGVMNLEVGININKSEIFDVVLSAEFENMDALVVYQSHPAHKEVVEFVKKIRINRAAVDYEIN